MVVTEFFIITPIKTLKVGDIFGKIKLNKNTDKLMKEVDKEFENIDNVEFVK